MDVSIPEFSRLISVSRIPSKGVEEHLEARPAEREALAKRFDLIGLPMLRAQITLTPSHKGSVIATGAIQADVVQCCVATLEPLTTTIRLDVNVVFIPDDQREGPRAATLDELEDEFEYFSAGKIDVGEMVAQQLGVNLDPYPRKPDAEPIVAEFTAEKAHPRPFAKLSEVIKLNKNKEKGKD